MFETPNHDRQKAIFAKGSIDTAEHFSQCVNAVCKYIKLSEKPNLKAETLDMSRYLRLDSSAQLNLHLDSNVQNESTIAKFGFIKTNNIFIETFSCCKPGNSCSHLDVQHLKDVGSSEDGFLSH